MKGAVNEESILLNRKTLFSTFEPKGSETGKQTQDISRIQ